MDQEKLTAVERLLEALDAHSDYPDDWPAYFSATEPLTYGEWREVAAVLDQHRHCPES